jgi:hypothetical protein
MSFLPLLVLIARLCVGIILKFNVSRSKGHVLIHLTFPSILHITSSNLQNFLQIIIFTWSGSFHDLSLTNISHTILLL